MAQSNFAMRMLEKQGWKEGDGLGKNRDGISKPIKAFMKRDKAGVGQDLGADLTDHWWLRVFNDAAKSNVTKTLEAPEVKQNLPPQNSLYAGFRKGSTLKQGKEEKDSDCSSEDEGDERQDSSVVPTLDDIHKYCGGATGHRAATLGIKMTGKLKRAAEHERLFNERAKDKIKSNDTDTTAKSAKKRKKDKVKENNQTEIVEFSSSKNSKEDKCVETFSDNCDSGNLIDCEDVVSDSDIVQTENVKRKKIKKKKRRKEEQNNSLVEHLDVEDACSVKKKKKSKSNDENRRHSKEEGNSESVPVDKSEKTKRKKKKHKE